MTGILVRHVHGKSQPGKIPHQGDGSACLHIAAFPLVNDQDFAVQRRPHIEPVPLDHELVQLRLRFLAGSLGRQVLRLGFLKFRLGGGAPIQQASLPLVIALGLGQHGVRPGDGAFRLLDFQRNIFVHHGRQDIPLADLIILLHIPMHNPSLGQSHGVRHRITGKTNRVQQNRRRELASRSLGRRQLHGAAHHPPGNLVLVAVIQPRAPAHDHGCH